MIGFRVIGLTLQKAAAERSCGIELTGVVELDGFLKRVRHSCPRFLAGANLTNVPQRVEFSRSRGHPLNGGGGRAWCRGRTSAAQAECRGFASHRPLESLPRSGGDCHAVAR